MSYLIGIKCPVCGESVSAPCDVRRGWSGDYFSPPEPDDVQWNVSEFEFECECRDNIEQNAQKWETNVIAKYPQVIRVEETPSGYVRWWSPVEYKKDADGKFEKYIKCPMLNAYDDDLNRQAESAEYHYEPDEPFGDY